MRNLAIAVVAGVLVCAVAPAGAVTVDVEDMLLGSSFSVGQTFTSGGMSATVKKFNLLPSGTASGTVTVGDNKHAGGAGNELLLENANIDLSFGIPLNGIGLQYGDLGGNLNLNINGDFQNFQDFVDVDNMVIGGTNVFVVVDAGGAGAVFVVGPVSTFSVGGQELAIDNIIANGIPEPATLALLGLGGLTLIRRRKA